MESKAKPPRDPSFKGWPNCDACKLSVSLKNGELSIGTWAALDYERWYASLPQERMVDLRVPPEREPPEWFMGHIACSGPNNDYQIEAVDIATPLQALDWTVHLSGKRWWNDLTWERVIRRLFTLPGLLGTPPKPERRVPSKGLRFEVLERDGFRCVYCGSAPPDVVLHLDHVQPRSLGGPTTAENLVTACSECNIGKGAHEPLWLPPGKRG